jgi:hypothetical protein
MNSKSKWSAVLEGIKMRRIEFLAYKPIRAVAVIVVVLLAVGAAQRANKQEAGKVKKDELIYYLKNCKERRNCSLPCQKCKTKTNDFIEILKKRGVDFPLTEADEEEIRQAGDFLGEGLDELVEEVACNYSDTSTDISCQGLKSISISLAYDDSASGEFLKQTGNEIKKILEASKCSVKGPTRTRQPFEAVKGEIKGVSVIKFFSCREKSAAERIANHLRSESGSTDVDMNLRVMDDREVRDADNLKGTLEIWLIKR